MAHYSYDLGFQRHILASFLSDPKWAKDNLEVLNPDFFGNELLKGVAECSKGFLEGHDEPPSKDSLLEEIKEFIAPGRKFTEYEEEVEEIYDRIGVNTAYYQRKAKDFSKVQLYAGALQRSLLHVQNGDIEELEKILGAAKKQAEGLEQSMLYDFWGKLKERALSYLNPGDADKLRISTGYYLLDDHIQGGLGQGETGVIIAPPKHGKTTTLISFASNCLVSGKRVFYVTLELRKETILLKFDTNLFGSVSKGIKGEGAKEFYKAMRALEKTIKGNLTIMEYPTKSLTLNKLQSFIERVGPDVVFVDYASIMRAPYKREDRRFEITDLHEGIRKIAGDCNVPIWTAHQANRPALSTKVISMEHIAEDLNVAAIADIALSVNQTEEERRKGLMRIHVMGNRLGASGDSFEYKVNWALSKIFEDHAEKEDLD